MIQSKYTGSQTTNNMYLRFTDADPDFYAGGDRPLISIQSQQTKKFKYFMPSTITTVTTGDRYSKLTYSTTPTYNELGNLLGVIQVGTTDFPFGFYDLVIYKNSSNANLDPANVSVVLYTGLFNLISTTAATQYTEYTTNDSDTESVYLTI
tara:strand:+ start:329 stop:781 length:453 start_codon:yes stop_codon:yes gene_type:complete